MRAGYRDQCQSEDGGIADGQSRGGGEGSRRCHGVTKALGFLCGLRYIYIPPFTPMISPVMNEASGEARKATAAATSSGLPKRPIGVICRTTSSEAAGTSAVMSVSMKPGATALTVAPFLANSRASVLVRAMRPPLAAA